MSASFRLATWNCFGAAQSARAFLTWRGAEDGARFTHPALLREIAALDVLCVQEVWLKDVEEFFDALPLPHKMREPNTTTWLPFTIGGSGLGFASRGRILEHTVHTFTGPKRSSERVARKGVSFARVELPDGPIVDLFTTHMQSGYDAPSARVRKAQLDQIRAFVDQKSSRENATIVCGDFNINGLVDARDGEYASMLAIFDDFSDPFADDDDITYHPHETHNPLAHRFEPEAPVQRVDYILYRRGGSSLELTECGLWMKEPLAAIEGHPKVHASDHFGLCVTLKRTHE